MFRKTQSAFEQLYPSPITTPSPRDPDGCRDATARWGQYLQALKQTLVIQATIASALDQDGQDASHLIGFLLAPVSGVPWQGAEQSPVRTIAHLTCACSLKRARRELLAQVAADSIFSVRDRADNAHALRPVSGVPRGRRICAPACGAQCG